MKNKWGFLIGFIALTISFALNACDNTAPTHHATDTIDYASNAPAIEQAVATQRTAIATVQASDKAAAVSVSSADGKVQAVAVDKPDARLSSAHVDLVAATKSLTASDVQTSAVIAAQSKTISDLAAHITADDSLLATAQAEAKGKADAQNADEIDKAKLKTATDFIEAHKNDFLGQGVHRFFAALSWTLLIALGVLAIAVGVLGCIYGFPKITQPALTWGGTILNWIRLALGKIWKYIATAFPWIGHEIYNAWENFHVLKQSATVVKVAVPNPAPAQAVGAAAPSPELLAALRRRGVAV